MSEGGKPAKVSKPRKPAEHPKYETMIMAAIAALKERNGSSRQAIVKHVTANNKVDPDKAGTHVKLALKRLVKSFKLTQTKGTGASGSFKINKAAVEKPKPKVKQVAKPKKPAAKKPAAKKPAAKPKTKKVTKKKAVVQKKPAKKPAKKQAAKKSPAKSKKPAAKKPVAKKPAAKKSPSKAKSKAKKPAGKKPASKKK